MKPNSPAIVFDYDLTLVDLRLNGKVIMEHLRRACRSLGLHDFLEGRRSSFRAYIEIVDQELADCPRRDSMKRLLDQAMGAGEMEALNRAKPLEGSREVLSHLSEMDAKIGIVTSNSKRILEATARKFHLRPFFDQVRGREDPGRQKPRPDKLISCVRDLKAKRAIFIGDDITDMQAAREGGFRGIGVIRNSDRVPTLSEDELVKFGASKVINSIKELPVALDSRLF